MNKRSKRGNRVGVIFHIEEMLLAVCPWTPFSDARIRKTRSGISLQQDFVQYDEASIRSALAYSLKHQHHSDKPGK